MSTLRNAMFVCLTVALAMGCDVNNVQPCEAPKPECATSCVAALSVEPSCVVGVWECPGGMQDVSACPCRHELPPTCVVCKTNAPVSAVCGSSYTCPPPSQLVGTCPDAALPPPVAFAKVAKPRNIAVDDTSVYLTLDGGDIVKIPQAGGTPVTLATGQARPHGIAVDPANVYWTTQNDGKIMSVPKSGGAPTTLASGQNTPLSIAVDATNVYWSNAVKNGVIRRVPVGGGTPINIATADNPMALAIDQTHVYWTEFSGIYRAPTEGTGAEALGVLEQGFGIAVDSTFAYVTEKDVRLVLKEGGGSDPGYVSFGSSPIGVAVDSEFVYFVDSVAARVSRVRKGEWGKSEVIATDLGEPWNIALTPTHAYVTDYRGTVFRIAKAL